MMEEKIKISLPMPLSELLRKDCRDFKILKKDGSPNVNAFINRLILHYHERFCADEEELNERIRRLTEPVALRDRERMFVEIKKLFAQKSEEPAEKKNSTSLAFKPTKQTEAAVLYIEAVLPPSESLSSFYRRMFASYAVQTKNEREKIIYKELYEELQTALKKDRRVMLKFKTNNPPAAVSVFAVSSSQDELFNYLLAYDGKKNHTVRLANLETVHLLPEKASIPEENQGYFRRQIECGAQYQINNTDNEPIRVQLTEKGKALFEKIYLYRPKPISVEGDIYTFDCSASQVLYYFERFGDTALILSPKRLGIFMRNYYYYAYKKYKNTYRV